MEDTNSFRESGEQQENQLNNSEMQSAGSGNHEEFQERPRRRYGDRGPRQAYRQDGDRPRYGRSEGNDGYRRFRTGDDEGNSYRRPRYGNGEEDGNRRPYTPRPRYSDEEGNGYRRPRYNSGEEDGNRRPYTPRPRYSNEEGGEYRRPHYNNGEEGGNRRPYTPRPRYSGEEGNGYRRPRYNNGEEDGNRRPYTPRPRFNNEEGGEYRRPRYHNGDEDHEYRRAERPQFSSDEEQRPAWQAEQAAAIPDGNAYQPSDAAEGTAPDAAAVQGDGVRQKRRRIARPAPYGNGYQPVSGRPQWKNRYEDGEDRPRWQSREQGEADGPRWQKPRRPQVQQPKQRRRAEIPEYPDVVYTEPLRLNKFIANTGICSRREADEYILAGRITVNGQPVTELGVKVNPTDTVTFDGKELMPERKVYLLLNKPKGFVTSLEDEKDRKTVMDLVRCACRERIYPVGRLDRQTTGVLLFTNDGDLALKLTHPANHMRKIYQVQLDRSIPEEDLKRLSDGIELEDGFIAPDAVAYANDEDPSQVGVEIHSGRNRIVRRMFEAIGYNVKKLDRVYFAGLSKKGLKRGKWRFLSTQEVAFLKMMPSN